MSKRRREHAWIRIPGARASDTAVFAGLSVVSLAVWLTFASHTGRQIEDALITYRYARNLAAGQGFVFNPGERVLGTTTPLFTLILALCGRIFGVDAIPAASRAILLVAGLATGLFTFASLRRAGLSTRWSGVATGFFLIQPATLVAATAGMETMLVLAFMAASWYAISAGRYGLAGLLCGLLVFTRIDGLVWSSCVVAFVALQRPSRALRVACVVMLVLAPWIAFATWYFGSFIPHSVAAKLEIATPTSDGSGFFPYLQGYARWFLAATGASFDPTPQDWAPALAIGSLLLISIGSTVVCVERALGTLRPLAFFPPLLFAFYVTGRAPRIFDWYLAPPLWAWSVLLVLGAPRLIGAVRRRAGERWAATTAAALIVLLGTHLAGTLRAEFFYSQQAQRFDRRLSRKVGAWLRTETSPTSSVMTEAIGYQGYYSGRRIIDSAGLVSPAVVAIHRDAGGSSAATFHGVLQQLRPDYLVVRSFEIDRNQSVHGGPLFASDEQRRFFEANYQEVFRVNAPYPGFARELGELVIFERSAGTGQAAGD